jgi:hypothetical protein
MDYVLENGENKSVYLFAKLNGFTAEFYDFSALSKV